MVYRGRFQRDHSLLGRLVHHSGDGYPQPGDRPPDFSGLGLAPGIDVLLAAVFDLASWHPDTDHLTGCDALDALVCTEVGRQPGCMRQACQAGQAALIARTEAGFASADGEGDDLQWGGTVDMSDADGDGIAEALGPGPASSWTAQFRSSGGPVETVDSELSATAR